MIKDFTRENWREFLPVPVCEEHPEYEKFYYIAWEMAHDHIRKIEGMPSPFYMDEAFCDTQIWIWDSCFMSMFCKYAPDCFPGVETLQNFYLALHEGKKLGQIIPTENEPDWTGAKPGEPFNIQIQIADNPPLFAWAEYQNALFSGDKEYLKKLLYEDKFLQKHYEWIEQLKEKYTADTVNVETWLTNEGLGYKWEGGRSGMDNSPRGKTTVCAQKDRPNNPNMLWIDAICQQALSAKMISNLYNIMDDSENALVWEKRFCDKKQLVNDYYWDAEDGYYYDIDCNTKDFYKVMTIASYWVLMAEICDSTQAEKMLEQLLNPKTMGGKIPLISLSRSDADFSEDGRYWRGALWLPTAYATLCGLYKYGFYTEAQKLAKDVLDAMLKTYNDFEPHTIWEAYSPEKFEPAKTVDSKDLVRPDFCGWSALGPVSIYIEHILGFHTVDAFKKCVEWQLPTNIVGQIGIKNLRFAEITTDILSDGKVCTVLSNKPYILKINGKEYKIESGENQFNI